MRPRSRHTRGCGAALAAIAAVAVASSGAAPASAVPSPTAPNPHPPLGAHSPDGSVPGGAALAGRGLILPRGAPALPPNLTARSWVLVDLDRGTVLAARDPHGRYQPASILKTLTAVTLLPHLPGSRQVTISAAAAAAEGSAVGLLTGAKYTVDQLFRALLLVSANDAAQALAEANGGVAATVAQMNAEAKELGAYDTLVQTPSGLDGFQQLTSAYDMALFLRAALAQPRFLAYDRARSESYPPKRSRAGAVGGYEFDNQSLDFFDSVPGALVAKTGYTDAALHTFLAAARRGGRTLGVIFLRAQRVPLDQYQQAAELLDWGFRLRTGTTPVGTLDAAQAVAAPLATASATHIAPGASPTAAASPSSGRRTEARTVSASSLVGSVPSRWAIAAFGLLGLGVVALRSRRLRRSRRRY